jgi:type II secretory pathway pseudopilin PulG
MIELAVVMAIVVVLAGLAAVSFARVKPRANLAGVSAQLNALFHGARQNALATGRPTVVMFFPQFQNPSGGTGRVVVYEDPNFAFFNAAAPSANPQEWFRTYDPALAPTSWVSDIFETIDLPRNVVFGNGGLAPAALTAPLNLVPVGTCTFCGALPDGRGAVVFDPRGRALFYGDAGNPLAVFGGSVALASPDLVGHRLLVITTFNGSVKAIHNG